MSAISDMELLHEQTEQTSLRTSRSRASFATTIRHKTSRFFGRNATHVADKNPQPVQVQPPPVRRNWFSSVGLRFSRRNHRALNSDESSSSGEARAEYWETAGTGTIAPPSSPEIGPVQPSTRRRRSNSTSRFKLHSLPSKFRRGNRNIVHPPSLTSLSDMEDVPAISFPKPRSATAGSWSSFRMGIQKAVREAVDGNFRFADDRGERAPPPKPAARPPAVRPPPARPPAARPPVRTLWTIMSADSSEGHSSPSKSTQGVHSASVKSAHSAGSAPVSPSASSHNVATSTAATTPNEEATPAATIKDEATPAPTAVFQTESRACSVASSSNLTTVLKPTGGGGDQISCCSRKPSETVVQEHQTPANVMQENGISASVTQENQIEAPPKSPAREKAPELPLPLVVLQDVGNKAKAEAEVSVVEVKPEVQVDVVETKEAEVVKEGLIKKEDDKILVVSQGIEAAKKEDVRQVLVGEGKEVV